MGRRAGEDTRAGLEKGELLQEGWRPPVNVLRELQVSIQTGQLTNDHIVAIGHLGHSNSHMSDLDQETIS